jgi:uncharacterized membrane protein YiaA
MANSQTVPTFTIVFGWIVFLIGLVTFCLNLFRGQGLDLMSLGAMVVGIAAVVVGRRIIRKSRSSNQPM